MASSAYEDPSQWLLKFGNFVRERALSEGEWHPDILDPSEVNWIFYHTTQDDSILSITAKNFLTDYDDAVFTEIEEELEVMLKVWTEMKIIKRQACGPPRDRQLLECFVNCFYVISRRANFNIDHLSERLAQHKGFLSWPNSGITTGREDAWSDGNSSEQAGNSSAAIIPNDIGESDASSLQDYESDPDFDRPYQISAWPTWDRDTSLYESVESEYESSRMLLGESEYEASEKSDDESQHGKNKLRGTLAIPRKRKADEIEDD